MGAVAPIQVWIPEQLGSFLAAARPHRLFAFYRLAAYTGARRGEFLYLRWSVVNLDAAEVTFGGSTAVVRGQRVEGTTKGSRSRTVSLDRETVAVLQEHRGQQTEERLAAGSAWNDNGGLVFTSRWGEPLYPDTVTALMTKLINRPRLIYRVHRIRRHGKDRRKGFTEADYARLLDAAHQQLGGPLVVVWDNLNTHLSAAMTELITARDWLTVCQLPPYAHELNPVELVWSHLKRSLAKRDISQLTTLVKTRLKRMQYRPSLLGGFLPAPAWTSRRSVTPTLKDR